MIIDCVYNSVCWILIKLKIANEIVICLPTGDFKALIRRGTGFRQ